MSLVRFLVATFALLLLVPVASALVSFVRVLGGQDDLLLPLAAGTLCGIAFDWYVVRVRIPVFATFEHELTHAVASLLFFRRIHQFVVTMRRGGHVTHSGGFGGTLGDEFIGLAPYLLPTFTAAAVLITPVMSQPLPLWWSWLIGFTFGYHLFSTAREIRRNWTSDRFLSTAGEHTYTDIGRRGFVYSALYIATGTVAVHGMLLAVLLNGYGGVVDWARIVWPSIREIVAWLASLAAGGVRWAAS